MPYVTNEDYKTLLDVWSFLHYYVSSNDDIEIKELKKRYESYVAKVMLGRADAKAKAKESMRKWRANNPEKAKEYAREYMKTYRKEKDE